ncbi:MAG: histidinol-phosphate transaminase [bacterium]
MKRPEETRKNMSLEQYIREDIASREGYSPGHESAEIILDANESPYDLPDDVKQAIFEKLRNVEFNRYPDSSSTNLRTAYAEYCDLPPEWIVAGNGSDEIISCLVSACLEPGDTVLTPSPGFSMYGLIAEIQHADIEQVPLSGDWDLTEEFVQRSSDASLIFLGYPNNPTGVCFSGEIVNQVIDNSGGLVVVDEAYFEFSKQSFLEDLSKDTPLVLLRTLSKGFSLAGIRTGFLLGPPEIVDAVNVTRLPYNVNRLSQVVAETVLEHRDSILHRNETILEERKRLMDCLEKNGLAPQPTDANFILFQPDNPQRIYQSFLSEGIRIRSFSKPELEDYLRLNVGTPEENDRVINVLDHLFDNG